MTNYRNPKETNVNANVFLKDVDKSIKIQDIDKALSKYGKIFSSKISTDENGESRGYGYVQFETEKEADECLTHIGQIVINEKPLNIERYLPKTGRPNNAVQNNLYLKNLPKVPEGKTPEQHMEELEKELKVFIKLNLYKLFSLIYIYFRKNLAKEVNEKYSAFYLKMKKLMVVVEFSHLYALRTMQMLKLL